MSVAVSAVGAPGAKKPAKDAEATGPGVVVDTPADVLARQAALARAKAKIADEASAWMAANIGENFELQPRSRSRGKEHVGDHIASEEEIATALSGGVGDEAAMVNLSAASQAEDGSKLVYMSTAMAVRLAPTPPYVAPHSADFLNGHSVDKLTPDVEGIRVAVAQHVPIHMEWGYTVATKSKENP